jgi:ATP-dependent helicase/DNAse subunit B
MATLLLSPAGSGKTAHILQCIRQVKDENPLAAVWVIVPNQLQAAGFRRRLAEAGGALGVEIFTFYTLYAELLARAGQPLPALLDPVQIRLLRAIVDELCAQGMMRHYAPLRARPGFVLALRNAIQELKRARVFPEDFAAAVNGSDPHLREISAVYSAYQDWLQRQNWADLEGRGWLAAIALEQNPNLAAGLRLLVVTGFDEFNPTQLGVLSLLALRASQALISLTGDAANIHRPAHHRFRRAYQAIAASIPLETEPLSSQTFLTSPLAYLEVNLFEPATAASGQPPAVSGLPSSVEFIEAQNRAIEVRAALRWIKARIVRDGLAISDVAVLARNMDPYRPFIEETAAEFGIPLRIVGGRSLTQNPAVAALLALLSLPAKNWERRPLVEAWRSPYFDWSEKGITPADAAALDAASRQGRVTAGLDQWQEAFGLQEHQKMLGKIDEDAPPPLEEENRASLDSGVRDVKGLREKFDAFVELLTPPETVSARNAVAFIEDIMGDDPRPPLPMGEGLGVRVVSRARANPSTAERDVAALRAFKDVLRGLTLAEAALQTATLDYLAFYDELRGAVEAAAYTIPSETGVLAASALDARGLTFRAVALLGLSEGEFPQREREDPFLSESDRQFLRRRGIPLESRLTGDEGTIFYQAITRAREQLLLTRPYLADDGQPWEESPYWKEARRLLGNPIPQRIRPENAIPLGEAASSVEIPAPDECFAFGRQVLLVRLAHRAASAHEGELPSLADRLEARYPSMLAWSPSKLEAYGTCPFYFYVAYALGLEPRIPPEEGYDVRMLGSMMHKILEDTYAQAHDPTDRNECLALMETLAAQVFAVAPGEYGFRPTPLWAQQQQELIRTLRQTITALAEQSQGFTPRFFEQKFGMGNPSLVLQTETGEIRLHGYIDRIDADANGRLRVIDYKAGGAAISPRHLTEGRRLQLPLYALAARDALGLGEIAGGFYWHIQKAEASSLKLENYESGVDEACETAVTHVARHVAHISTGQFQPQPPAEGCPNYCPAASFCWRFKAKGF